MLKNTITIFVILIAFAACNKQNDDRYQKMQELVFTGSATSSGDEKTTTGNCDNLNADYAVIVIDGVLYRPDIFYINGVPYTQSIKFPVGTYHVDEFILMQDAGKPGLIDDDAIVQAIPMLGSEYAKYVMNPVSFDILISEFGKTEVAVETICFDETDYELFGFDWFTMTEITTRAQLISGSLCVEYPDDYDGSLYENQTGGLQNQMPAIYKIDVYRNSAYLLSYNNENSLGEDPLEIEYPDHDHASDHFEFELFVLVKTYSGFNYELIETWSFDDDQKLISGNNHVVDFVVGGCNPLADYFLSQ